MTKKELHRIRQRHLNHNKYKKALIKLVGSFLKIKGYFGIVLIGVAIPAVIILPNL